jgi:DNA-binding CsgD family transcriptional regulator
VPAGGQTLVARAREQAALASHVARACDGDGSIVLVAGEAGVGKTTLARTVLRDTGIETFEGFGVRDGVSAYGPVVELLRALLHARPAADVVEAPLAAHLAALLPELGAAPPSVDRGTLFEAIRSMLARAAAQRPLALFLDDMQWADAATLDLLPALARALDAEPVLLLVAYRSDDVPREHPLRRLRSELRRDHRLHELALASFDRAATAMLLETVLGAPASPSLCEALVEQTDGVPFFVAELGHALASSARLVEGPDGLELLAGEDLPVPESVRDAVLLRASGLGAAGRAAVTVAAVAGQQFEPEAVMAIAGLDAWPQDPSLSGLLVDGAPGQLAFRHALVRDAFYDEIPWLQRRALHRQVAERLELGGAPARILAEHWALAGETARARRFFLAEAAACCIIHAYIDGARAGRRALELWPDDEDEGGRIAALEQLGRCAEMAGDPGEAVRARRDVVERLRRQGDPAATGEATRRLAAALEVQGRWDEALAAREEAAVAFARADAGADAAAERLAAAAHLRSATSYRAALELLELALRDARRAQRRDLEARILGLEGNVRARMGDRREGLELVRTALTMALDANLTGAAAEIYQRLADSLEHAGEYTAAKATYDDAFAYCTTGGLEPTAQTCLACLAVVLRQTGDWERAVRLCRDVLASPSAAEHARGAAACTLGLIHAHRGMTEEARPLLLEGLSIARRIELKPPELLCAWGLAIVDQTRGETDAAADACRRLLATWRESEDRHYAIAPLRWATTCLAEAGDGAGARACAAALADIATGDGQPEAVSALAHALGESAFLDGDAGQAASQFARAVELLKGVGAPIDRLESERRAAAALVILERREEAIDRLISAHRTAKRLRARPTLERLARALSELGEQAERRMTRRQAEQLGHQDLTRRELDVLRVLTAGRTNREIAAELIVSTRTVDMHVRNILRKLDCRSRTDAARQAVERGLVSAAGSR